MTNTATISKNLYFALLGFCLYLIPQVSQAQYATASAYPFIAAPEPFQYLAGGTPISALNTDDATATNIPIGFSFPFCNTAYTIGSVSSNGWFSLSTATGNGNGIMNNNYNFTEFQTYNGLPVIMPFWDDLGHFIGSTNPTAQVSYLTTGTAPNRVFTMEWRKWSWDFSPIEGTLSFQLKLYENGSIKFQYKREAGPIGSAMSVASAVNPYFGASIGIAKTLTDLNFINGSTMYSKKITAIKPNIDSRPFTDQMYLYPAPCAGVVSATVVGPPDICPDSSFNLAAITESMGIASSCVWYYSEDGVTWITATSTAGMLTDAIKAPRWYKAKVTCGSQSFTTPAKLVDLAPHYKCYCPSSSIQLTSNIAGASAMDIGNVNLIRYTIAKDSLLKNYEPSLAISSNIYSCKAYSDFTQEFAQLPVLYKDSIYRINVNTINFQTQTEGRITAYIDYNHNSIFDDSERIVYGISGNVLPLAYAVTDTFKVRDWAEYGITRMRVILKAGTTYPDSCGNYQEGETEDYLVKIDFPPCSGPENAGKLESTDTSMCAGYTYLLTDTTYEKKKGGLVRSWQISADGVYWNNMLNTTNKDTLERLFTGQPLYYRVAMVCTNTNDSTFTDSARINLKAAYKCYCYSQAEGGLENDTSDIGAYKLSVLNINDGGTHLLNPNAHHTRTDRTDLQPINMDVDSVYSFYVFHTMPRNDHADAKITVFIDFNNNHVYDIPYERIFTGFTAIGYHTLLGNVIIPNNVITETPTGMRIILNNNVAPNPQSDSACGPYVSGETEDYIVVFKRPFETGVADANSIKHMSVFPNPSQGRVNVQFSSDLATAATVKITDIAGRVVHTASYEHAGGVFSKEIDLGTAPKGIYIVELNAGGQHYMSKLVLQ